MCGWLSDLPEQDHQSCLSKPGNLPSLINPVWDKYPFLDEWISKYIRHDKTFTNEYPNKFALEKINEYFSELIYLYKILEYILTSYNLPKKCFFFTIMAIFIFCVSLKSYLPLLTNNNHLKTFLGINETSNIFAIIDIGGILVKKVICVVPGHNKWRKISFP